MVQALAWQLLASNFNIFLHPDYPSKQVWILTVLSRTDTYSCIPFISFTGVPQGEGEKMCGTLAHAFAFFYSFEKRRVAIQTHKNGDPFSLSTLVPPIFSYVFAILSMKSSPFRTVFLDRTTRPFDLSFWPFRFRFGPMSRGCNGDYVWDMELRRPTDVQNGMKERIAMSDHSSTVFNGLQLSSDGLQPSSILVTSSKARSY